MIRQTFLLIILFFIWGLSAQNSSETKEKATGTKNTIVESKELTIEKNIQFDESIEKEIQRRVAEEVKKITEKEIQKRVDEELAKRIKNETPEIVEKEVVKKVYLSSFKETQYAEELYEDNQKIKARSVLNVLKNDKDKKLSEEAHFLLIKWFGGIYFPVIQRSENYNKVLSYKNNLEECDRFKKAYPKSKYLKELQNLMNEKENSFNKITKARNMNLVDLKDSCQIKYKGDSTYVCSFKKTFKDKQKKDHDVEIKISGKITKYDPYGDLENEWDTSGLIIDNNSAITVSFDNNDEIIYDHPVNHKQSPEYELRRVEEYGFSQNKTFVKEHKVEDLMNLATPLGDNFIISNLEVRTIFGKMNELASMDVIYAAKPNGNFFSDRFKSKCYVELTLDEVQK